MTGNSRSRAKLTVWRPAPAPRLRRCRTRRRLDEPRGYRAVRPRRCGHAWGTGSVSRFQPGLSPRRHRQCLRGRGGLEPWELLRAQREEATGLIHDPGRGVNLLAGCRARARRRHAHAAGIRELSRSESRKPDSIRDGLWQRAWCSFRPTGERLDPFHQVGHRDRGRDFGSDVRHIAVRAAQLPPGHRSFLVHQVVTGFPVSAWCTNFHLQLGCPMRPCTARHGVVGASS